MQKGTITVLGHQVEYENHTGDNIDMQQLEEQIELGDRRGNIYWDGYIVPIGTWKIINPEADKWREIAGRLYRITKLQTNQNNVLTDERVRVANEIMQQYEQLIQEENGKDN